MKNIITFAVLALIAFSSCTNAYKLTQTPDDVYFSPTRGTAGATYQEYASSDDRYLRMKTRNYNRWAPIDDYSYWYDSRYYYNNYGYSNYYNPYSFSYGYGGYYPTAYYPYYPVVYYKNPKSYQGTTTNSNVNAYRNNTYSNTNTQSRYNNNGGKQPTYTPTYNNPNTGRSTGTPSGSNSAGGRSGGYNSTGTSAGSSRAPRG